MGHTQKPPLPHFQWQPSVTSLFLSMLEVWSPVFNLLSAELYMCRQELRQSLMLALHRGHPYSREVRTNSCVQTPCLQLA